MRKIILITALLFAGITFIAAGYYGAENDYNVANYGNELNND